MNAAHNPFKKWRLRIPYRLLILLVSVSATALVLLSLLLFFSSDVSDYIMENSSNLYILQTQMLSDRAEYIFSKVNNITDMLLSDEDFRSEVKKLAESDQVSSRFEPYNTLLKHLNHYALNQQSIANITLFTQNKTISTGYKALLNQKLDDALRYLGLDLDVCREQVQLISSQNDIPQNLSSSIPAGSMFFAAAMYEEDTFIGLIVVGVRDDALLDLMKSRGTLLWQGRQVLGCALPEACPETWIADGETHVVTSSDRSVPRMYVRSIVDNSMAFVLQEDLDFTYEYTSQFQKIMLIALGTALLCAIALSMTLLRRVMTPMTALQQRISAYENQTPEPTAKEHNHRMSLQSRLSIYVVCTVAIPSLLYLGVYYGTASFCIGAQMKNNYQNTFNVYADSLNGLLQEYYDAVQMMGLDLASMNAADTQEIQSQLLHDSKIWNLNLNMLLLDAQRSIVYTTQSQSQSLLESRITALPFGKEGALITEIPGETYFAMEVSCMDMSRYPYDRTGIGSAIVLLEENRLQSVYSELCGAKLIDVYVCSDAQIVISSNCTNRIGEILPPLDSSAVDTSIALADIPLTIHFYYNEAQLTSGVAEIVYNRLQSAALIFLALMALSSWIGKMLVRPLEHIRRHLDDYEIIDITEIYAGNSLVSEIDALGISFNNMKQRIDELMDNLMRTQKKEYQLELDRHMAELHLLQLQIHPHFLCNLLESIRSLNELGDHAGANAMIHDLGDFFRYSISREDPMVLLEEEIAFTRAYCNILSRKYHDDIRFRWRCDSAASQFPVLRLMMQPLIENAVYHGLMPNGGKGLICISCILEMGFLILEVTDDGCGMDTNKTEWGVGLTNVNRRMELYYKEKARLEILSRPGQGTRVRLYLPINP